MSFFSVGLKDIRAEDAAKVSEVVMGTLKRHAENGFEKDEIDAAVNTIEFELRENNSHGYPRGLIWMLRCLRDWIYGQDPIKPMQYEAPLERVKAKVASDPKLFQSALKRLFLDNPHRATVLNIPDPTYGDETERKEAAVLEAHRATLSKDALEGYVKATADLKARQAAHDSPEALATIPCLKVEDLDKENRHIPCTVEPLANGGSLLVHDLFTNGVVYLDVGFSLAGVPPALLPLVPLFTTGFVEMGTATSDFVQLQRRIGMHTGGIKSSVYTSNKLGTSEWVGASVLRGKCLARQVGKLVGLLAEIALTVRLDNPERLKQLALKEKAELESTFLKRGDRFARARMDAQLCISGWVSEQTKGLSYYNFVKQLLPRIEKDWPSVLADLKALHEILVHQKALRVSATTDGTALRSTVLPELKQNFIAALPAGPSGATEVASQGPSWAEVKLLPKKNEALVVPTRVNYVGKTGSLASVGYTPTGATIVVARFLENGFLWDNVRVSGGAYGVWSSLNTLTGLLTCLSYRDPNFTKTLDQYDEIPNHLATHPIDSSALTKAIVGAIGDYDPYELPDAKAYSSFTRFLTGVTEQFRATRRAQILGTTAQDFPKFGEVVRSILHDSKHSTCVAVCSDAAAVEANSCPDSKHGTFEVQKVFEDK
eukprot:RCo054532